MNTNLLLNRVEKFIGTDHYISCLIITHQQIKHLNNTIHKQYTGVENDLILKNFDWIIKSGYNVVARIPIIPEVNTDSDYMHSLSIYLDERKCNNFSEVHLLPYHHIGCAKYEKFNVKGNGNFEEPSGELIEAYADLFKESGFKTKIGG